MKGIKLSLYIVIDIVVLAVIFAILLYAIFRMPPAA